ncbi:MAG: folate hydrolase, partial [Rhodothermales bacterium]|nr:folate hydrolase [Rhodothermales bacterium]
NSGGSYHSAYDSYEYYVRFGDPGFAYGEALAKVAGRVTLRLANADVLPFRYTAFADNVSGYVDEVVNLADTRRKAVALERSLIADGAYDLSADPTKPWVTPEAPEPVPHLNFAPLLNARKALNAAAADLEKALADGGGMAAASGATAASGSMPATAATPAAVATSTELNEVLYQLERAMTREAGLPKRPWFRHQIYAPGYYTGYGVKTLPAIREAIEQGEWDTVDGHIADVSETLHRVTRHLRQATELARTP